MTIGLTDERTAGEDPSGSPTRPAAGVGSAVATAVVLATARASDGGPAALMPWEDHTVLRRLAGQLVGLGVRRTLVLTRPPWEADVRLQVEKPGVIDVQASDSPAGDLEAIARVAAGADGAVLVAYGDIVTHRQALAGLIADPRVSTGILAGGRRRPMAFRFHARRARVIGAASPYHNVRRPNATFLGVLRVGPAELVALGGAAERLAPLLAEVPAPWQAELDRKAQLWRRVAGEAPDEAEEDEFVALEDVQAAGDELVATGDEEALDEDADPEAPEVALSEDDETRLRTRVAAAPDDVVALLLVGLVRDGVHVRPVYLRCMLWARPLSAPAAARVAEKAKRYDEDRLRLDSAVKSGDGFFTTFFVSPYSKYIARWAARRGFTPNQVTVASLLLGLLATAAFATGERPGLIAGAVLLQLAFTTDCVDGQLARYTLTFSKLGAWLDSMFDRAKEYLVFGGLAIGAARAGDEVWLLACSMITLQTVRHMSDFAHMSMRSRGLAATPQPPLEQVLDSTRIPAPVAAGTPVQADRTLAERVLAGWRATDRARPARWIKKMIAFPIGERFAVISITAALFTPRVTFIALLAWGGAAFAYMHAGRVLRSIR